MAQLLVNLCPFSSLAPGRARAASGARYRRGSITYERAHEQQLRDTRTRSDAGA